MSSSNKPDDTDRVVEVTKDAVVMVMEEEKRSKVTQPSMDIGEQPTQFGGMTTAVKQRNKSLQDKRDRLA